MSDASITIGVPIVGPGLPARGALSLDPPREFG
jgi:hypothetical protein